VIVDILYLVFVGGWSIAAGYALVSFNFTFGFSVVASLFYGIRRSGNADAALKQYTRLSCYVATVVLIFGLLSVFVAWKLNLAANAEWGFGVIGAIYVAVICWVSFSVGYVTRRAVTKWV